MLERRYRPGMDLALLESVLADRGEPWLPRAAGLGVDGARLGVVRAR